jgi:uncharacterized protein (UPF0147 family)
MAILSLPVDPNTVVGAILGAVLSLLVAGAWTILRRYVSLRRNRSRLIADLQKRAHEETPKKIADLTYTVHRSTNQQELVADNQGLVRTVKTQMASSTRVALLTGRFGAGKTTVCRVVAGSMADGDGSAARPLALNIDVLRFDDRPIPEQISARLRTTGVQATTAAVEDLFRSRHVLLLLDGLDQLPYLTTGKGTLKIILDYAKNLANNPSAKLAILLVMRQEFVEISEKVQEFRDDLRVPVIQVHGLTPLQIDNFIRIMETRDVDLRLRQVTALLQNDNDMFDLLSMPVILGQFIVAAPESIERFTCTGTALAQIYKESFREKLATLDRELLERFAFDLFCQDQFDEHVDEDLITQFGGTQEAFDHFLEKVGILRVHCSFIRFTHASFRDYFVSEYLLRNLREGAGESALSRRIVNYLVAELTAGLLTRKTADKLFEILEQTSLEVVRANAMDILAESEDENIREQLSQRISKRLMSRTRGKSEYENLALALVGSVVGIPLASRRILEFLEDEGVERLMKVLYVTKDGYLYYDKSEDRCHLEWIKMMAHKKYGSFRVVIARVLTEIGVKKAIPVLDAVAKDESEPEDVRKAARSASYSLQKPARPSEMSATG